MRRTQKRGLTYIQAGVVALVILLVGTYFGFTKSVPFRDHYEIKAVFESANSLRKGSLVRIAGVNVGKVTDIKFVGKGRDATVATMRIDDNGLPIHKDATVALRPRIFLEGNLFVDIKPGTPSAPKLEDGDTIPINQTSYPVQLDQVLTTLQSDIRADLKDLLYEYSTALDGEGAKGFNRSIPWWEPAFKNSAIVNQASLGLVENDLSEYIENAGAFAEALDRNGEQLKSLITDFNTTSAAFARESGNLEAAIGELPRTLAAAQPALAALNDSFPPVRRLVADLRPATRSSEPAIDASRPFIAQARGLVSKPELRGLVADLRPTVFSLARLNRRTIPLYRQVSLASSCQNEVILPWSRDRIEDRQFPAKGPVFQEGVQWLPGISGESRSGDANGQWFRVRAAGGNFTVLYGNGVLAQVASPIQGTNPPKPRPSDVSPYGRPPINAQVPCETQERPDLRTEPGPPPTQFRNDIDTPAEKERYVKARKRAVDWLREQLEREGLDGVLAVADEEATPEMVNSPGLGKLAPLTSGFGGRSESGGKGDEPPAPGPNEVQLPGIGNVRVPPKSPPNQAQPGEPPAGGAPTGLPEAQGLPIVGDPTAAAQAMAGGGAR